MEVYRVETKVSSDGTVLLEKVPFQAGEQVEVIVRAHPETRKDAKRYPLRGTPVRYTDPFESVDLDSWRALN
jgi:hypothetical protein